MFKTTKARTTIKKYRVHILSTALVATATYAAVQYAELVILKDQLDKANVVIDIYELLQD